MIKQTKYKDAKTESPYNDLPFLPPKDPKIESAKVLRQLVKSSVALAELKGLAKTLPNPNILLNAVILKEARASSEIENVITTQDKLYQALSAKGMQIDSATKEVLRYRESTLFGLKLIRQKGFLNVNGIIAIQKVLEETNSGIRKLPGTALRNASTGKVIYTPPGNYDTILKLLRNLENYLNETDEISPLIKMAIQHYQFESIHPFYDGNGRTGRIINVLYLILQGSLDTPILYLSEYIINTKADYYRLLQEVRSKGKWEDWVLYILKGIEATANKTIAQVGSISNLLMETQDVVKKKTPKSFNKGLIELCFVQPYIKIEFVTERLGISRITASKYLKAMKKIGVLESKKVWKETIYINTRLFDLLRK